jgi:hypothetical protein
MHNIQKKNLAILLEFGFHEIKKYIHSGFAQKLSEHFNIIWLAIDKGNREFDNYFRSTDYPVVYISRQAFPQTDSKTETHNLSIRRHWMVRKNLGAFHNYSIVRGKTFKSTIIGSGLLKKIFEYKTLKLTKSMYSSKCFKETFQQYEIDHVLATGYDSTFAKSSFITANELGIKTWYLVNSWKDLYINNFIPFDFLNGIFVWSDQMKCDYLFHMSYLDKEKIHVSGNPTFDVFINSKPHYSRDYYARKYNIEKSADWLLYTMMPPGLVSNEIDTIILLGKELLKTWSAQEKIILVRKNPNHSSDDFVTLELPENIIVAEHFCTFDKRQDMIIQTPEGEKEWIDLLHHCSLNLSVPSTVTLEFLALKKPVLNIGFGPDGNPDPRFRQHFEAGFYRHLFMTESNVKKILKIEEFLKELTAFSKAETTYKFPELSQQASEIIVKKLLE